MADGKITIELSVDSKNAASDLSKIGSQLKGLPNSEVTVPANVRDGRSAIRPIRPMAASAQCARLVHPHCIKKGATR